ncbi:hypothetical protein A3B32_02060 [Candidatus Uhrbacteria bacterium RIFCSPLOWO2_01_FULL_53_9]|nr:MAG: hypothetical protein A3B32_02060 [Candidatus Uhrbacteria bacterium RIFCSPLOWO2_01_FULL_53_9]
MNRQRLFWSIGIVVAVAFLSAVLGSLMARQSIDDYMTTLQELPLSASVLSTRRPPAVPGTYAEAVDAVQGRVAPSVLLLVGTSRVALQGVDITDAPYVATILTSDGWVLTDARASSLGVFLERAWFPFDAFVRIPDTSFAFGHIERDLNPVVTFGLPEDVRLGTQVFVYDGTSLYPRTLSALYAGDRPARERAETPWRLYRLDREVDVKGGAIVVDASGALLGVIEDEIHVRPWHTMRGFLKHAFASEGALNAPVFGVLVVDRTAVYDEDAFDGLEVVRVDARSLAAKSGIKVGDIITHINGHDANDRPLSERWLMDIGLSSWTVRVERDGETLEIVIELSP